MTTIATYTLTDETPLPDGTYTIIVPDGVPVLCPMSFVSGYQVADTDYGEITGDTVSASDAASLVADIIRSGNWRTRYIGVYTYADGARCVEVSARYGDRETALAAASETSQESIYDWANDALVYL